MASLEARLASLITALGDDYKLNTFPIIFSKQGALTTTTGKSQVPLWGSGLIVGVTGWINTAPTGSTTFKVDVNLSTSSIYGTQANRPTWTAGDNIPVVGSHSVTEFIHGSYLSVDIDSIGSTIAGSDLTLAVWLLRTGSDSGA